MSYKRATKFYVAFTKVIENYNGKTLEYLKSIWIFISMQLGYNLDNNPGFEIRGNPKFKYVER